MVPPLITLEEHFFAAAILDNADNAYAEQYKHIPGLGEKLRDLGPLRLSHIDSSGITLQVISHGPASLSLSPCQSANDQLSAAIKANPARFAGFAVLPMSSPQDCPAELTRCIKELGFVGALIDNRSGNTYYDEPAYLPFWSTAASLGVPIYLHPTWPSEEQTSLLYTSPSLPPSASFSLSSSGWGWHSDVALHVLRLYASGLFDKHPTLKIIIGHMGEMLPFMLQRIIQLSPRWGKRERLFKQVWDENIWITTSGVWSVDPMATILRNTRVEHVLFSVDYPFAKNEDGLKFMEELEQSGLVSKEGLERIAYRNAEELLGVRVQQ